MRKILMFDNSQLDNETVGTAYCRIDKQFSDFLKMCEDKHGIVGITYDFNDRFNFGIILGEKHD